MESGLRRALARCSLHSTCSTLWWQASQPHTHTCINSKALLPQPIPSLGQGTCPSSERRPAMVRVNTLRNKRERKKSQILNVITLWYPDAHGTTIAHFLGLLFPSWVWRSQLGREGLRTKKFDIHKPQTNLPLLLGRELTAPFHFLDGTSSGFKIIKYTHTWADCLTLEKCLCVWRQGSIFWKHFILEEKWATFHPHQNTSPKVHLCIQKAQTSIWAQLPGNLLDLDGAVFNGPFSGCLQ